MADKQAPPAVTADTEFSVETPLGGATCESLPC
jgi:hypothetical protein